MDRISFIFLSFILFYSVYSASAASPAYTMMTANQSIRNATAYLQTVNESGYLIFYPSNLSAAYAYLNKSETAYSHNSPALAVEYSDKALFFARSSYLQINYYRTVSIVVMLIFTAVIGLLLYRLMKPVKITTSKRRKR
ncbi:MAG: hypothetical protein M1520_01695 [Candidatus Marsarchaeota archaeon]|jgi:hypothetical protein|nr:hypothetical protein [Candidatus Marsarchaeota archaeon]